MQTEDNKFMIGALIQTDYVKVGDNQLTVTGNSAGLLAEFNTDGAIVWTQMINSSRNFMITPINRYG